MRQFYRLGVDDVDFINHYIKNDGRILSKRYLKMDRTIKPKYLRIAKILDEYRRKK